MAGVSVKLPLSFAPNEGYSLNKNIPEMIKQNLKNLFLTIPGERMMDPEFGVGLKKYLFEQNVGHNHDLIKTAASKQIKKYMPFLNLRKIDVFQPEEEPNALYISVFYTIPSLNQEDMLNIEVTR